MRLSVFSSLLRLAWVSTFIRPGILLALIEVLRGKALAGGLVESAVFGGSPRSALASVAFDSFPLSSLGDLIDIRSARSLCGLGYCVRGEKTGSLVSDGLICLKRGPTLDGYTIPGEHEDIEVGVDPLLHIPGEEEYLIEGVLAEG